MSLIICVTPPVSGQETVNDPELVMDLTWEIGSWTDIWRIEQFKSAAVGGDVSFYIYLPPAYHSANKRYPVVYWFHGAYGRPYSATPIVHFPWPLFIGMDERQGKCRPGRATA